MGIFSFLSSDVKAKSFTGKTAEAILNDTKLDKLSEEIVNDEGYGELTEETKNAIQMLLDLKKGKMTIYNKCYAKGQGQGTRPASIRPASMRPPSMRPASMRPANVRPASMRPASGKPNIKPAIVHNGPFKPAAEVAKEEQSGGGRRRKSKKTKRSNRARKSKTHRRH
jgi:hypothetical protein